MSSLTFLYAQSGGVTPVINASAAAVIETARAHGCRVLAAQDGIIGALEERLIDTQQIKTDQLQALTWTPGGAFGSCRFKLRDPQAQRAEYDRLIEVLRTHEVDVFLYNGGNDSADTSLKLAEVARQQSLDLKVIGIPKTIDNDLAVTDNCPGFGTVAKYVATSILEASLDVMSMASSSTKVFILEVMGRHAGWIAAAGGLAASKPGDPPQIILMPEVPLDKAAFLTAVQASVDTSGYCSIVVSEGVRDAEGVFLSEAGTTDAFGHRQLGGVAPVLADWVKQSLNFKCHWALSDYLQRAARHIASATDLAQARAVGVKAVELGLAGESGVMPVIRRLGDAPYRWSVEAAPLAQIANKEKTLPASFIRADGFGITEEARRYLAPLIEGESPPPFVQGLPAYFRPRFERVPQRLPAWSVDAS